MNRVHPSVLDELIEHKGKLKHWPINQEGVFKLAVELKEARARIAELEVRTEDASYEKNTRD